MTTSKTPPPPPMPKVGDIIKAPAGRAEVTRVGAQIVYFRYIRNNNLSGVERNMWWG